jgi:hypothetical protein
MVMLCSVTPIQRGPAVTPDILNQEENGGLLLWSPERLQLGPPFEVAKVHDDSLIELSRSL